MGSSSGASSGSTGLEEAVEQRKRKRMLSNRESARRSRQRKQRRLDELAAEAGQLRRDNAGVLAALAVASQSVAAVESENAVLRTRTAELAARLQSLGDILFYMNAAANGRSRDAYCIDDGGGNGDIGEPWYQPFANVVAVADMFQYC